MTGDANDPQRKRRGFAGSVEPGPVACRAASRVAGVRRLGSRDPQSPRPLLDERGRAAWQPGLDAAAGSRRLPVARHQRRAGPLRRRRLPGLAGIRRSAAAPWQRARPFPRPTTGRCGSALAPPAASAASSTERLRNYSNGDGLPGSNVLAVVEDRTGTAWAGSLVGLFRLSGDRWERVPAEHGLPADLITALFEDRRGHLWVGTDLGTYRRSAGETAFGLVSRVAVVDFSEDSNGVVWGIGNGGLVRFDEVTGPTVRTEIVGTSILADRDGTLWVGTLGRGVLHLDLARRDPLVNRYHGETVADQRPRSRRHRGPRGQHLGRHAKRPQPPLGCSGVDVDTERQHAPGTGNHRGWRWCAVGGDQQRPGSGQRHVQASVRRRGRIAARLDSRPPPRSTPRVAGGDVRRNRPHHPDRHQSTAVTGSAAGADLGVDDRSVRGRLGGRPRRTAWSACATAGDGDGGRRRRSQAAVHHLRRSEWPRVGRLLRRHPGRVRWRPGARRSASATVSSAAW